METLDFPESFVACDLKLSRYIQFIVLIKVIGVLEVKYTFYLDQHDHSQRSFI